MIPSAVTQFLNESNRTLAGEAARVTEQTERAEALRSLKQRVKAAAADGSLDAGELDAIEAEAKRLGVDEEIGPLLDRIRAEMTGGSVPADAVSDAVRDVESALGTAIATAFSESRPSLEMQLAVQADQIAMQMFSATSQAYHHTAMNIIGNLKA